MGTKLMHYTADALPWELPCMTSIHSLFWNLTTNKPIDLCCVTADLSLRFTWPCIYFYSIIWISMHSSYSVVTFLFLATAFELFSLVKAEYALTLPSAISFSRIWRNRGSSSTVAHSTLSKILSMFPRQLVYAAFKSSSSSSEPEI